MDQFIATAVAEKLASLATMEYLEQRARRSRRERCHAVRVTLSAARLHRASAREQERSFERASVRRFRRCQRVWAANRTGRC